MEWEVCERVILILTGFQNLSGFLLSKQNPPNSFTSQRLGEW
ncbi:MAG: hypothetical protein RJA07_171 [Bacteroidota bacterium]|jgi:hypothetical protein